VPAKSKQKYKKFIKIGRFRRKRESEVI